MIRAWNKKKSLDVFVSRLPTDLSKRYGVADVFSKGQIQTTLEQLNYPEKYRGYAYAIFLSETDAILELGSLDLVDKLRSEIADSYFDGNKLFSFKNVKSLSDSNLSNDSIGGYDSTGGEGSCGSGQ